MKTFPEIRTKNYLLRQFSEYDLENVFKGLSNKEVVKYYDISFNSLEETKKQISWFSELEQSGTGIWWAISSHDNSKFYGAVGFSQLNAEFKNADIGFWLLPEFWGIGIMSETFPVICQFGFEKLGLHRIQGEVESENIACKKAMIKFNFKHEGTKRECEIKNGTFINLEVYSKLEIDK